MIVLFWGNVYGVLSSCSNRLNIKTFDLIYSFPHFDI